MTEKKNSKNFKKFISKNYWMVASIILAVALIAILAWPTGVGKQQAGENAVDYLNSQTGGGVELVEVTESNGFYQVVVSYQGQEVPIYMTKDGENLVQGIMPLTGQATKETNTNTPAEIPQTTKPQVELYIWSYCPYGVTALGPFSDVAKLLGDSADFDVMLYYAGHGAYEEQQNKIQACIQDLGYEEEYWNYAKEFANTIYQKCSGDIDCDLTESTTLMNSNGIDSDAVLTCVEEKGDTLLAEHYNSAKETGVTGSPTLLINDVKANVARDAESYKGAVCSAYENAPEDCATTLSTTGTTATGSC